jgi:hypothetical protein
MSRSSIFSSESCDFRPKDPAWKAALTVVVIAVAILVAGELVTRVALGTVGRRWEYWHPVAATKFEFVRKAIEQGRPIKTLVVGDSTGAADFNPAMIEQELGARAWNVAWSGNFPLAFEQTTLPLLTDSRLDVDYVIASFIPAGFASSDNPTSSEAGLLGSTYIRIRDTTLTGQYVFLARLRSAWPFLLNGIHGRREPESVRRFGYAGTTGRATQAMVAEEPNQPPIAALNARRVGVLRQFADALRKRGVPLVVVIPPSLTNSAARLRAAALLNEVLMEEEAKGGVRRLDMMRPSFLDMNAFADVNHLNTGGAALYSTHVARIVKGWYAPGGPAEDSQ